MDSERILAGLNAEQRAAAEATRGPVCILAGAGTGKTTTITRRIAWQVASGAFQPSQVVAVTFTDKAAGELRARLAGLGVEGVRASTFHSAALALLRRFGGDPGRILGTKALLLRRIGNGLPKPYRFRPAGDLATEIEWAKNRRLTPATYLAGLGDHEPPLPPDLAHRVFREYERRKAEDGALDFEDLLERAIRLLEEDDDALATVRDRWRAFTVDEYQDVNVLQQTLLEFWLGTRDDVCVVGDDYQSIYGFTGASAEWLLGLPTRFPHTHVVRLEQNYRSTPQVLELANRLVPRLGGSAKTLRPTLADGPEPDVRPERRRRRARRAARRRGRPARGAGGARADERAHDGVRGGVPRGGDPVPGRVAARPRRRTPAAEGAARRELDRGGRARAADGGRRRDCWRIRRRSSATASRRGSRTWRGSSGSRSSSTTASARWRTSPSRCTSASARPPAAASICSRSTAPRDSSSRRCTCRGSRRASCRSGGRRARRSRRSGACSTSA